MSRENVPPNSHLVFQGPRFDVYQAQVQGHVRRDVVVHPGAVVILPFLTKNQVLLIKNERFAVGESLWELPAGTKEPGEEPITTAHRELIEETGYASKKMEFLCGFYTSPGFCNEWIDVYAAYELVFQGQQLDPNEKIDVFNFTIEEAINMVKQGQIKDAKTICALLFFQTQAL